MRLTESQLREILKIKLKDERGKNLYGQCPKCGHDEFGISLNKFHPFGCFRKKNCGWEGNIYDLLSFLKIDVKGYKRKLKLTTLRRDIINPKAVREIEEIECLPECKMPIGFKRVFEHKYLRERGFTDYDFKKYDVGITNLNKKLKDYIIIGIRQNSILTGYIARSFLSKEKTKELEGQGIKILRYNNSKNDFSKMLLGLDDVEDWHDTAILVEKTFGKINIDNHLNLNEKASNTVCLVTFGAKLSSYQVDLILSRNIKHLIFFFDPDVDRIVAKEGSNVYNLFESVSVVSKLPKPNENIECDDMNKEQLEFCLKNKVNLYKFKRNLIGCKKI